MKHKLSLKPDLSLKTQESSYQKTVLESGIRIVTEQVTTVRSVSIGVWINTGSRDEEPQNSGISHFLEHMVFKGTKNYSLKEISESMESVGGYLNAFTTKEQTCFFARALDEHIEKAIAVIADLVQHPTFPEKELVKERMVVLDELKNAEDDPEDYIHELLEKKMFPKHQLGVPVIGTEETVKHFSAKHLRAYTAQHYVPSNMVVAVAGNIPHAQVTALVQRYFTHQSTASSIRKRFAPPPHTIGTFEVLEKPIQQAHICMGTTAFSVRSKYRYPLLVMQTLLGEGMSSRLFQTIREKHGLAYSVYSYLNLMSDTSTFGIYLGTDVENVDNALGLAKKELEKLAQKPISKQELARTKSQLKGTMMLGLESMSNRMMRLGGDELYFGEQTPISEITKYIDDVTVDSVLETAQKVINMKRFSTIVLKPGK